MAFIQELKEEGILELEWIPGIDNASDLFTKNLHEPLFKRHATTFVGKDNKSSSKEGG